ncbi:hypothetical protein [Thioalkalivibrio sp. ALJ24]|uniref:hypothetical protein n=1 Tax=Thioalkalivibrio sp. ALJ24 TaxID=545276 RepID=UPI0012E9A396|nr:hypothetical protein [Thioalkalivibrio sp. ALJ24]
MQRLLFAQYPKDLLELAFGQQDDPGVVFDANERGVGLQAHAMTGARARDLEADLERVRAWV